MLSFSTGLVDPLSSSCSEHSAPVSAMGDPPGPSGRAWLEAHSSGCLVAEAAALARGRTPPAA
eukprot:6131056-Alexandrium_andersonii.AAC.1